MSRPNWKAAAALAALLLAACSDSNNYDPPETPEPAPEPAPEVTISVISSAPERVSGGDARIVLSSDSDDVLADSTLEINGDGAATEGFETALGRLEGVISGLAEGENTLALVHPDHGELASLTLTNYPRQGPIFSGPQQQPFVCSVQEELGVQPLVDAREPPGLPVYDEAGEEIEGYSRNCQVEPFTRYMYVNTEGEHKELPDGERPEDMATIEIDGEEVDFVVRWELGTINRFIYSIAMLAEAGEEPGSLDTGLWNNKLIYRFQGGVGIGYSQGEMDYDERALQPDLLARGYAIAYSTGNRTGVHYNLEVGGETALMVKERFIEQYGVPSYTVGLGASGGAIQQYVYGQNLPGLIDAGVPIQSYPDMVTQMIHVGDCELLEYFMDATDGDNPKWQITENRELLVGMNATDAVPDETAPYKPGLGYATAPGSTECIDAWRGLTSLAMNPKFGEAEYGQQMVPPVFPGHPEVDWSHYADLRNIYGEDEDGWPRTVWDNVGVQYGLQSLKVGDITPEEFIRLNARVGGWKQPRDMVQEGFPFTTDDPADVQADPSIFDPWSSRNMTHSGEVDELEPRTEGNIAAMEAAYESGMVFHGKLDIPVIDFRPYLEKELDMHNSHQSFAVRQRMLDYDGDADNQLIWFMDASFEPDDAEEAREWENVYLALEVLDDWMANIRENPEQSVAENRPAAAVDKCFNNQGQLIHEGSDVWNGMLDDGAPGLCTEYFRWPDEYGTAGIYGTSRTVAGAPIQGDYFKCALKPVDTALEDGTYGGWQPDAEQVAKLKQIFPGGVCDYSKPDRGNPFAD